MNDPLIEQLAADLKQESLHAGRAVVLGMDGVPHSLLVKLMSSGVLPNISWPSFVEAGALGFLRKGDNIVERSGAEKKLGLWVFDSVPKPTREFAWNEEHRRSVFALGRRRANSIQTLVGSYPPAELNERKWRKYYEPKSRSVPQ